MFMNLSDLQSKEIINVSTGRRVGIIIDVIVEFDGKIRSLIVEEKRTSRRIASRDSFEVRWSQIVKIGDDIILIDNKY